MSKETGSSEFSFCSTTDSSHSLGASHFLLPLPFSMWKMGVILTSFIVWSVRHVPRHTLGKWFSPWLKKSLREAQARVTSNRGQGWVRLCIVQLSCCKWDPKTRGRLGDCSPHAIYYNTYWEQISYRRMPHHQPPSSLGSSPPLLFPPPLSHTSMSELLCVITAGTPRFFHAAC